MEVTAAPFLLVLTQTLLASWATDQTAAFGAFNILTVFVGPR
jgi:hypothetical protein